MQGPDLWKTVLAQIHNGTAEISQSEWRSLVSRKLVPEVKQEIARFYGGTDDLETQYPGLDYANANHRLRLSSFPCHRALFRAFDVLKLTEHEIYTLCKWHGTKKAKDDFERKNNTVIEDTTWEGVAAYERASPTVTFCAGGWMSVCEPHATADPAEIGEDVHMENRSDELDDDDEDEISTMSAEESEDEVEQSVGVDLNQRLRASAETNARARARGEPVSVMDDAWEQWLKEAAERAASPGARRLDMLGDLSDLRGQDLAMVSHHLRDPYLSSAPYALPSSSGTPRASEPASSVSNPPPS